MFVGTNAYALDNLRGMYAHAHFPLVTLVHGTSCKCTISIGSLVSIELVKRPTAVQFFHRREGRRMQDLVVRNSEKQKRDAGR